MDIPNWIIWGWSVASTLAAGIFALLKSRSDAKAQKIDSLSDIENQNISIWNEVDICKQKLYTTIELHREEKNRANKIEEELIKTKKHLEMSHDIITKYIPLVEIEERLKDLDTLEEVLDAIPIPLCATASTSGGSFSFVNRAFADILEINKEDVQDFDWRSTIHPDDLKAASLIEASALEKGGSGLRTRYRLLSGKTIHLVWCWSSYRNGVSISVAEILAVTNSDSHIPATYAPTA